MESLIDPHWRPDSRALGYPPSLGKQAREHRGNGNQGCNIIRYPMMTQ
jgi:hypothetical protein